MSVRVFADYDGPLEARCEVIVIGSGPGGAVVAKELAQRGGAVSFVTDFCRWREPVRRRTRIVTNLHPLQALRARCTCQGGHDDTQFAPAPGQLLVPCPVAAFQSYGASAQGSESLPRLKERSSRSQVGLRLSCCCVLAKTSRLSQSVTARL